MSDKDKLAQNQSLRQDVLTFINYVGKGLCLTQVSKNLTLKDVRAINSFFTKPEELDEQVGDHLYKLRNEEQARRVHFIRHLCQTAGLVKIRRGRISQTKKAGKFITLSPFTQLSCLFSAWWWQGDWGMSMRWPHLAAIYEENADYIATLLSGIAVGDKVPFILFAEALSDQIGHIVDHKGERDQRFTNMVIDHAVIRPLERFGLIEVDYKMDKYKFKDANAFVLTHLGQLVFREIGFPEEQRVDPLAFLEQAFIDYLGGRN